MSTAIIAGAVVGAIFIVVVIVVIVLFVRARRRKLDKAHYGSMLALVRTA